LQPNRLKVLGRDDLVKDRRTGAVLNIDKSKLQRAKAKARKEAQIETRLLALEATVEELKRRLGE